MEAAITLPAGPSAGLFADLGGAMFRRVLRILGDEAAAARHAETLFVRFVVYVDPSAQGERARWNWIYRVATIHSLRQLPDGARPGGELPGSEQPGAVAAPSAAGPDRPVAGPDILPDMGTLRRMRMDEATQCMLVLSLLDGLTPDEIAEVLGLAVPLVRRRLDAARARLPQVAPAGQGDGGGHPSSLALERDRVAHAAHLTACNRCRAAIDMSDRLTARFARELAPAAVVRVAAAVRTERGRRTSGPRWKRLGWLGGGLAAVCLLALVVARPRAVERQQIPYAGVKGASRTKASGIQIAVGRGEEIRALKPGLPLQPNDRLFFRVKAERLRYLELRVRDASGERRIFPRAAAEAVLVRPGQPLDADYVVPAAASSSRPVWIIGLFADHPFPVDQPPGRDVEVVPVQATLQPTP